MEGEPNIITSSGRFIIENLAAIIMFTIIFVLFRFYFLAKNIKIEKQKTKVKKVLMVEKMENILDKARESVSSDDSCMNNNTKELCVALGSCVWATTKDSGNIIGKCLASEGVEKNQAPGSNGPSDICHCSSKGKLIPWEKYYYMKGRNIIEKKAPYCSAKGDSCKQ